MQHKFLFLFCYLYAKTQQRFCMTMAQRNLADLPVEILQPIASLLRDTHRPSFYAFCATNRRYRLILEPLIFHELHVSVGDCRALQDDVHILLESLSTTVCGGDATQYVRQLCLKGLLYSTKDDGNEVTTRATDNFNGAAKLEHQLQRLQLEGLDQLLDENKLVLDTSVGDEDYFITPEQNVAWAAVANLIKMLPNLTRLVYNCHNQFPPSLLNAMHSHRPKCRLYHHTFRFRSLSPKFDRVDPHELAVARSPCLYSVKLRYSLRNKYGETDQNLQAIWELVAGLAPNLKEVSVLYLPYSRYRTPLGDQHWQGLPGFADIPRGQTGSLSLLSVTGILPVLGLIPDCLQKWASHTDFSSLRQLSLGGAYHGRSPESYCGAHTAALEFLARACSFPQLETLHILLMRRYRNEYVDPLAKANYINAASAFFESLRPLRELSVSGSILPEILGAILTRHGRTVVDLRLRPFEDLWARMMDPIPYMPMRLTREHILQINDHCPKLESLSMYVKRTMSDASEVELYRSLAQIRPLQSLLLTLDCSNWQMRRDPTLEEEEARFDDHDKERFEGLWGVFRRGHVRQSFINCAVDETLARSIWGVIAAHKDGKRLLSLTLYTTGAMNFGVVRQVSRMAEIVHHLSRSWLIERGVRDDEPDALDVTELGLEARKAREKELKYQYPFEGGVWKHERPHAGVQVFRRIWPEKEVGSSWKDDWTSYPLQI